jgi:hypothetical protein
MGWDAYATKQGKRLAHKWEQVGDGPATTLVLADDEQRAIFAAARARVLEQSPVIDGFLETGGLDVSTCAKMLEEATDESAYSDDGWSAEGVKLLAASANWEFEVDDDERWAYWSARVFLETCAAHGFGIVFDW